MGTPAGAYDIAWGLLSPDMQRSYGLDVESGILTIGAAAAPAPAVAPTATTATPPVSATVRPADVVARFYSLIDAHDLQSAWNLLSPRLRSTLVLQ